MKSLFYHASHENAVAVSNMTMNHHNDKSFHDSFLDNDQKTISANIRTNIRMLLCSQNDSGHFNVTFQCKSPVVDDRNILYCSKQQNTTLYVNRPIVL